MLRVLVVTDHAGLAAGLSDLLTAEAGLEFAGSCSYTSLGSNRELVPDLVLADDSGNDQAADSIARVVQAYPQAPVLVLTARPFHQGVREALEAGAAGCVVKGAAPEELLAAVREHGEPGGQPI